MEREERTEEHQARYIQVYKYYKELILSEQIPEGTRLPSIRRGSMQLQMSKTTMESAYLLLAAEGYIMAKPQSGYYVTDIAKKQKEMTALFVRQEKKKTEEISYDFVTTGVDRESFRFELWSRYMKSALRQDERLLSYGEPQGELEFREVLCEYLRKSRNAICTPEQIVIGAGVQSLLQILCPLIRERKKIAFYNPHFKQGITVFRDFGFICTSDYKEAQNGVYYITPSQMSDWGEVMPVSERMKLIADAAERDILLIEDDYNHEFQYFQKPAPALQSLTGGKGVVYLGTFSKMLLPSIRVSFMVLPIELTAAYEEKKDCYNQTASKAEQIALTQFIRDGHLERQIRKSRKIHMTKAALFAEQAGNIWGREADIVIDESGFHVILEIPSKYHVEAFVGMARKKGIAVLPAGEDNGKIKLGFACTNVETENYDTVLKQIKEIAE